MKKMLIVGLLFFMFFLALEYLWFKGTMRCVINRSQGGQTVNWAIIRDCSY